MEQTSRIALLLPRFGRYGGVEGYAWRLAEALAKRGHAVDFICARKEAEAPEGVRVLTVGRPPGFRAVKMLWFCARAEMICRREGYDLVFSLGKTWTQDISRLGGGPQSVFWKLSREAWPAGPRRFLKDLSRRLQPANWLAFAIEKHMFRTTPHIVAISDLVKQWVFEEYPHLAACDAGKEGTSFGDAERTCRQQVHTIYNYPDLSRFAPPTPEQRAEARRRFNVGDTYALGVATTNFTLKGVAPLIRAVSMLPADTTLHVAGGRHPDAYKALAASLGVGDRVHFHGKVTDMPAWYHALDMFVLPTFYDTFANVVLEADASGVKVLCSARAGVASFLEPEQILADPGDSREIAAKVTALRDAAPYPPVHVSGGGLGDLVFLVESVLAAKNARRLSTSEPHQDRV